MYSDRKRNTDSRIDLGRLRQELQNWINERNILSVTFRENTDPSNSEADDYVIVYEAEFVPASVSQAQLQLNLTDDGLIGVGLETRQRIAERLKVPNHQQGFADGFEPLLLGIDELLLLLDIVSRGEIVIAARVIPLYGLGGTKALPTSERKDILELAKRFYWARSLASGIWTRTVTFETWR